MDEQPRALVAGEATGRKSGKLGLGQGRRAGIEGGNDRGVGPDAQVRCRGLLDAGVGGKPPARRGSRRMSSCRRRGPRSGSRPRRCGGRCRPSGTSHRQSRPPSPRGRRDSPASGRGRRDGRRWCPARPAGRFGRSARCAALPADSRELTKVEHSDRSSWTVPVASCQAASSRCAISAGARGRWQQLARERRRRFASCRFNRSGRAALSVPGAGTRAVAPMVQGSSNGAQRVGPVEGAGVQQAVRPGQAVPSPDHVLPREDRAVGMDDAARAAAGARGEDHIAGPVRPWRNLRAAARARRRVARRE